MIFISNLTWNKFSVRTIYDEANEVLVVGLESGKSFGEVFTLA
jgi:hypothetical protein